MFQKALWKENVNNMSGYWGLRKGESASRSQESMLVLLKIYLDVQNNGRKISYMQNVLSLEIMKSFYFLYFEVMKSLCVSCISETFRYPSDIYSLKMH